MKVRVARVFRYVAPMALVLGAACGGDDNGTNNDGGGLSASERTALTNLFSNQAFLNAVITSGNPAAASAVAFLPITIVNLHSLGSLNVSSGDASGDYQAFGGQFVITATIAGQTQRSVWTGIIGVKNLSSPTDIISAGVIDVGTTTAPSSVSTTAIGTSGTRTATASYLKLSGSNATAVYNGTAGNVAITSASFSGGTSCTTAQNPFVTQCSYSNGTINGSFNFTGTRTSGTGAATLTVPSTTVSIPATRFTLTYNVNTGT